MKRPDARVFTVSQLKELPSNETFYIIAFDNSYVADGGWPGNDRSYTYLKLEAYLAEQEWKDAIKAYTQLKRVNFRAFVMTPAIVNTSIGISTTTK